VPGLPAARVDVLRGARRQALHAARPAGGCHGPSRQLDVGERASPRSNARETGRRPTADERVSPERAARPTLPAGERQARSAVITAMGNNPAAILVTIGILVETGAGPLSWSSLAGAARREGLLPPPGSSGLGGMLLEALTR
jgi:hypothetical protein